MDWLETQMVIEQREQGDIRTYVGGTVQVFTNGARKLQDIICRNFLLEYVITLFTYVRTYL